MKQIILKLMLALSLLTLSLPALSERLTSVETAYELQAIAVTVLRAGKNGSVAFRLCPDCTESRLKLAANTVFLIDREVVSRQVFRRAVNLSSGAVYVFVANETGLVARMELDS